MNEPAFDVFLRIRHPNLDPDEITRQLGLVPEHHWKAGDYRPATDARHARDRYTETYWVAQVTFPATMERPTSLEVRIGLAAALIKRRRNLWQRIKSGGRADLLVTLYGGREANIELSSETTSLLTGIGLSISLEIESRVAAA